MRKREKSVLLIEIVYHLSGYNYIFFPISQTINPGATVSHMSRDLMNMFPLHVLLVGV